MQRLRLIRLIKYYLITIFLVSDLNTSLLSLMVIKYIPVDKFEASNSPFIQ